MYDPKGGMGMVAAARKNGGVNHSCNDDSTIRMRQADPHSHALVLAVKVNRIASLADDLALAMRAQSIRIVAPIPGKARWVSRCPNPTARSSAAAAAGSGRRGSGRAGISRWRSGTTSRGSRSSRTSPRCRTS